LIIPEGDSRLTVAYGGNQEKRAKDLIEPSSNTSPGTYSSSVLRVS
jgi:hypothetical protein